MAMNLYGAEAMLISSISTRQRQAVEEDQHGADAGGFAKAEERGGERI